MIGKISIGKSFRGCLLYCLQDKQYKEQNNAIPMKGRAEVLQFNQCYGNDRELIEQFNQVRRLNPRLSKPVLHITLSLAPGEKLPNYKLAEIAQDCAETLKFTKNQFIAVLHKDTHHQHLHIVVNRTGFDGKTLSDSNNYQKMASFSRSMELKYGLKQVLNPRKFLSKEFRETPRLDQRKEKLKEDIKKCLAVSKDYSDFELKMKDLKYQVFRMRGIAFQDPEKVYTKGSQVGYSLSTIEKILSNKMKLQNDFFIEYKNAPLAITRKDSMQQQNVQSPFNIHLEQSKVIKLLLKSESQFPEPGNSDILNEDKKRRKKKRQRLS